MFARAGKFFGGAKFAALVIGVQLWAVVTLITMLFLPTTGTPMERFADEFRRWCFGDTGSGGADAAYVAAYVASPLLIAALTGLTWWHPLKAVAARGARGFVSPTLGSLALVASCLGILAWPTSSDAALEPNLEGMRTSFAAPQFTLTDHTGQPLRFEGGHSRVTLITAVYASCGLACPMILGEVKRTVASLTPNERAKVDVLAVTLDPDHDSPSRLSALATAQRVSSPGFRFLTGDAPKVNSVLDALSIARAKNPQTGLIDHANILTLVDRQGRVAYRFSLGKENEKAIVRAIGQLVRE